MPQKTTDTAQTTQTAQTIPPAKRKPRKATTAKTPARRTKAKAKAPAAFFIRPSHDLIARRAYEIWQTEIGQAHEPTQHWTDAQAQLQAEAKKSGSRGRR